MKKLSILILAACTVLTSVAAQADGGAGQPKPRKDRPVSPSSLHLEKPTTTIV